MTTGPAAPFSLALSAGLLQACIVNFVAVRDVPEEPDLVVLPDSVSRKDLEFSDKIQGSLIRLSVSVIERPSFIQSREIGTTNTAAGLVDSNGHPAVVGGASGTTITAQSGDVVDLMRNTNADYVLIVRQKGDWVKLIRRESGEVLFSGAIGQKESLTTELEELLVTAGIIPEER